MHARIRKVMLKSRDANGKRQVRYEVQWRFSVTDGYGRPVRDDDGEPVYKWHSRRFASRAEAGDFAASVKAGTSPASLSPGQTGFDAVADQWLASLQASGRKKPRTIELYRSALRKWIRPRFGQFEIAAITTAHAEDFSATLRASGLKASSARGTFLVFRSVLAYAVKHRLIPANPAGKDYVDLPSREAMPTRETRYVAQPPTAEEVAAIAANLPYPYDLMVTFTAYTGLRAGELAALKVGDIDLDPAMPTVRVNKTAYKAPGEPWADVPPKSARSNRLVDLMDGLIEPLTVYLRAHPYRNDPGAPLWPGREHGPRDAKTGRVTGSTISYEVRLDPANFYRNDFKRAVKAAGLDTASRNPDSRALVTNENGDPLVNKTSTPGVQLHDLRHFFASYLLGRGVPVMEVSEALGHASYTVTMTVYAHLLGKRTRASWAALDGATHPSMGNVVSLDSRRTAR